MKSEDEILVRIGELLAYDDYSFGPKGDNLRYKHQGMIDALRWVLQNS